MRSTTGLTEIWLARLRVQASRDPTQGFLACLAWAFLALALGQALGLWRLQSWGAHAPDLCLFHRVTGLPCPGCGMGRALLLLAQGRVTEAWDMHPLAPVLLGLAGLAALLPGPYYAKLMGTPWARVLFVLLGADLLHWVLVLFK
jgi:hypothetical protein